MMVNEMDLLESGYSISDNSVLAMIESTAAQNYDSIAVICGSYRLSYRELLACASINASKLNELGINPGDRILCALSADICLPVAWIAAMICRGCIIPIDLNWPNSRLEAVVNTSNAKIVIVNDEHDMFDKLHLKQIKIDHNSEEPVSNIRNECKPLDLAYGFFTSGSTGDPKCALNHHAGLVNRFEYMTKLFGRGHVVYQNSATLFDSSIWQILWPLTSGGTTVLPAQDGRWDLSMVITEIENKQITMTDFVPTIFKILVRALVNGSILVERIKSMRNILIGGEEINSDSVHSFRKIFPACKVINTYGHTEASIGMVFHEVCDEDGEDIPLGKPIDNTYIKIVDEDMIPVETGEIGEIIVAGICVGAGYLNAQSLTEKVFLPNPFDDLPGSIIYKSGDYGRWRVDGLLEYGGRADDQVKVRGVRIELSEMVQILKTCFTSVQDALALIVPSPQGDTGIALCYESKDPIEKKIITKELSRFLPVSHLPHIIAHYMSLPVSENGKTDRRALIKELSESYCIDELSTKKIENVDIFISCYRSVLLVNKITEDSNFFDLGGDSLSAVNLSMVIEERLSKKVSLSEIYQFPTPQSLTNFLYGCNKADYKKMEVPYIEYNTSKQPAPYSSTILLTGANGFVGIHILDDILSFTSLHVLVLMRGASKEQAFNRLNNEYYKISGGKTLTMDRIEIVLGDMSQPKIGMNQDDWSMCADVVDEIIHCAAAVNFLSPSSQLFDSNVKGTAELIRLCGEGKSKRFHHISTLAAKIAKSEINDSISESNTNGYGYTKYLADELVKKAVKQGMNAKIYRLDDVLPSISSGFSNKQSLFHILLKKCLTMKMVPIGCGAIGLMSVDNVANWITSFVGSEENFKQALSMSDVVSGNFLEFQDFVVYLGEQLDINIEICLYEDFIFQISKFDDYDSALLRELLPKPKSGSVVFTKSEKDALLLSQELPHGSLLSSKLSDYAEFAFQISSEMSEASISTYSSISCFSVEGNPP